MGDPDPVRAARFHSRLHGGARVVDVDVDVPQAVAADDHQGLPQGVQPGPQYGDRRIVCLQEIDHLEGGAFEVARSGGSGHRAVNVTMNGAAGGCGGRLAGDRGDQGPQHRQEPHAPGVDDPGARQHVEPVRGRRQGLAGGLVGGAGGGRVAGSGRPGTGGGRVRDGQDGALHRVRHGLPGQDGRPVQGLGDAAALRNALRDTAQQLGEDGAGVPAGAQQGPVRHRPDHRGRLGLPGGAEPAGAGLVGREHRLHGRGRGFGGQIQIGAGVTVRDRIDVDRVDLLALPAQRLQGPRAPDPYRCGVEFLRHLGILLGTGVGAVAPQGSPRARRPRGEPVRQRGRHGSFVERAEPLYAAPVA